MNAVEKKLTNAEYSILGDLVDELQFAVDFAAASIQKFLEIEDYADERPGSHGDSKCYETELDHRQLTLQRGEIVSYIAV